MNPYDLTVALNDKEWISKESSGGIQRNLFVIWIVRKTELNRPSAPKIWALVPVLRGEITHNAKQPSVLSFTRLLLAERIAICFTGKKYGYFLQHKEHLGEIPRWIPPDDPKEAQDRGCVSVLHYANRDHSIRLLLSCGDVSVQFLSVWFHFLRWIFCFRR